MSKWINLPDNIEGIFGIVYIIKNKHPDSTKQFYIGAKQLLRKTRLKPTKTRKRNKIVWRDNGVEEYWGSSKELLDDIVKYGEDYFTKEVIELCGSKFHMKYAELVWQIKCKALFDPRFYNGILSVRLSKVPTNFKDVIRDINKLNL